jgi:methionine biosynthesis protein MetW
MKLFLHKLRTDLWDFMRYPDIAAGKDFGVDYDIYWHRRGGIKGRGLSTWQKERADITANIIEPGSTVLDLGAGDGAMLVYLREKIGIKPIGVEVSKDSLDALRQNGIEAVEADITNRAALERLPEVDYITGFEILEHMPAPESLLNSLRSKARKGMIFSFPNTGYYIHRLRLLCGRFPLQWIAHPGEHLRFWTLADVRSWAPQTGLTLRHLIPYQGLPSLSRILPSWFAQGVVIMLEP